MVKSRARRMRTVDGTRLRIAAERFGRIVVENGKMPVTMTIKTSALVGQATDRFGRGSGRNTPGCVVESFRTLAAPDAYASGAGYRSGRDMKLDVIHRLWGA